MGLLQENFLIGQALVVQMLVTIQQISITEINYSIRWIVIYPVDSAIRRLNNRGQVGGGEGLQHGVWREIEAGNGLLAGGFPSSEYD